MTYDASSRKDIRAAEKAAKLAENNRIAYTRRIMAELEGREWIHGTLARCSIFSTPFVAGAGDITAFNCGTQSFGLQLFWDVVTHCPDQYVMMMREQAAKEGIADARRANNATNGSAAAVGSEQDGGRNDNRSIDGDGPDEVGHDPDPADYVEDSGLLKTR